MSAGSSEPRKLNPEISLEVDRLTGSSRELLIEYLAEAGLRVKKLEQELRGAELEDSMDGETQCEWASTDARFRLACAAWHR